MQGDGSVIGVASTKCFYCGEDDGIIMNSRLTTHHAKKIEAMHGNAVTREPCQKCQGYMRQGVIVITVDAAKSQGDVMNPYRTGFFSVLTDSAISRMITDKDILEDVLKDRVMWLEHSVAIDMGLIAMMEQMESESKLSADQRML